VSRNGLTDQTVKLMEHIQLDHVLPRVARDRYRLVDQLRRLVHGNPADADYPHISSVTWSLDNPPVIIGLTAV